MSKYKVGDRVRIINRRGGHWNIDGGMDKWMGKVMTIRAIYGGDFRMEECLGKGFDWSWLEKDFAEKVAQEKIVITHDGKTTTARLYDGKRVLKDAKAVCSSDDEFSFRIGARLAFNRLLGTDYHPSEVAFKRPVEPKPEPVKLYCVKGYKPGELLTKGRVYEAARVGCRSFSLRYDGGSEVTIMSGLCHFGTSSEPIVGHHLIPLVSRPAKVGEWVYALQKSRHHDGPGGKARYATGQLLKCTALPESCPWEGKAIVYNGTKNVIEHADYLVLDGYQPEEYYNGKVVCTSVSVAGEEDFFTEGKVYKFIDGIVTCNTGREYNRGEPIKTVNELQGDDWFTKFIPYLGEA